MSNALTHYRQKIAEKGLGGIIAGRWRWYKLAFKMDNWAVGKFVELSGNRVRIEGVTLSVDNPLVTTRHKGSLYFGIYENFERELSQKYIDRSLPVVEIGGSIGGVACITNKLLTDPTAHVVVECNPLVLPTLEKNRDINRCGFAIEPFALAYGSHMISFSIATDHFMLGRLQSSGDQQVTVGTITLKTILEKYRFKTINLISDSEGGEVEMVENEADLLRDHVKCLILETHEAERGPDLIAKTMRTLNEIGFEIQDRKKDEHVFAMVNRHISDR
jgi:FkbM family methyltransferase